MKTLVQRLEEGQSDQQAVDNLRNSYFKFITRINARVRALLKCPYVYFITFTIAPEYEDVPYHKVVRKIKETLRLSLSFIFNEDYGSKNGRLHFHGIVATHDILDYTKYLEIYQYGAINIKPITVFNEKALKEYVLKQQLHMTKGTAQRIYKSKKMPPAYECYILT